MSYAPWRYEGEIGMQLVWLGFVGVSIYVGRRQICACPLLDTLLCLE